MKILPDQGQNEPKLYGAITRESVARAEVQAPERRRVVCMAVTSGVGTNRGIPSSWSAAVDQLCFGVDDARRLILLSAGNIREGLSKAIGSGSLFTAWTVALFLYGDYILRSQVVFTVVITNMICSFILAQLPRVALALAGISMPGFLILLVLSGGHEAPIVALNLTLVGLFLAYMVMVSSRDFEAMVAARVRAVELAEENRRLANTDSLTGLPNRREFFERLDRAIREEGDCGGLVMGVIDLDGFKPINDLYGHAIGDCVLRECAVRLEGFASGTTTIARLGGDEFAIFVRGRFNESNILRLGDELCAAIRAPLRFADVHAGVSASIGFARFPADAMDGHHLYERADYALYFGKQNHRGGAVLFTSEHESKMLLNARIEQALRKADFEAELSIEYPAAAPCRRPRGSSPSKP